MKKLIFFLSIIGPAYALDFQQALEKLAQHESVSALNYRAEALEVKSEGAGAWGDPMFMVAANNLPKDKGYKRDVTPMTGIAFGISQKVPLGPKLSYLEESMLLKSRAAKGMAEYSHQYLALNLWKNVIDLRKVTQDLMYLEQNLDWLETMVKVSKKLYSNGKISQQALLDIQIRVNQVKSSISLKKAKIEELKSYQMYLTSTDELIESKTIPWEKLEKIQRKQDLREESLKLASLSAKAGESAAIYSKLPEVTLGVTYTKRENIDRNGDFVSFSVSFPLPFGDSTSSFNQSSSAERVASELELKNYQNERQTNLVALEAMGKALYEEFKLTKDSVSFARTARIVAAKSYRVGSLNYQDLLQAELRQQEMELKLNDVEARLGQNKLQVKLYHGDLL